MGATLPLTGEELERQLLQTQLEKARFELEQAKAAAHTQAQRDKDRDRAREDRVADLKSVAAGIDAIKGATLALPEKTVFRESLVSRAALERASAAAARAIQDAAGTAPVLITARTDQAEVVLAAIAFRELIRQCHDVASRLLHPIEIDADTPNQEPGPEDAPTPDSVFDATVGVGVAALNALTVETTVEANAGTISDLETHIAVTRWLLAEQDAAGTPKPKAHVLHDSIGIPSPESALLTEFSQLQRDLIALEGAAATLQGRIAGLDPKKPAHKKQIDALSAERTALTALAERVAAVIQAANTADAATGTTPLRTALRAHALARGDDSDPRYVAIVPPARLRSHQIALKRRLFAPRLVVSASIELDVVVLDVQERRIVAAGTHVDEAAFQVRFPMWWWATRESFAPIYTPLRAPLGV